MTDEQLALLQALDDYEWKTVSYRLGNFTPGMAGDLVREGLAERREREKKRGAYVYRRTPAGRAVLRPAGA